MKYIVEYIDPELLQRLQLERLRDVAQRLYNKVPYYRGAFDACRTSARSMTFSICR